MARFFLLFIVVLAVLFGIEMLNPLQVAVVHPWTSLLARLLPTSVLALIALIVPWHHLLPQLEVPVIACGYPFGFLMLTPVPWRGGGP